MSSDIGIVELSKLWFEQVTVTRSGEHLENNFVNPTYSGDQRVSIVNTSSASSKPVLVSLLALLEVTGVISKRC